MCGESFVSDIAIFDEGFVRDRVMLDCYEQGVKFVRQLCHFTFLGLAATYLAAIPFWGLGWHSG